MGEVDAGDALAKRLWVIACATGLEKLPPGKRRFNALHAEVREHWARRAGHGPSDKTIANYFSGQHSVRDQFKSVLCELVVEIAKDHKVKLRKDWIDTNVDVLARELKVDVASIRANARPRSANAKPMHPHFTYDITITPGQIERIKQKYEGVWSLFRLHSRKLAGAVYRELLIIKPGLNAQTPRASVLASNKLHFRGYVLITERALSVRLVTGNERERLHTENLLIMRGLESDHITYAIRTRLSENFGAPVSYRTIMIRQPELDSITNESGEEALRDCVRDYPAGTYLHGMMDPLLRAEPGPGDTESGVLHFNGGDLPFSLKQFDLDERNWAKSIRHE